MRGHSRWGVFPDPPIPKCSGERKNGKHLSLSPSFPERPFSAGKEMVAYAQPQWEPSPDIWLGKKVTRGDPLVFLQPREDEAQAPARHTQGNEPRKTPTAEPRCPPSPTPHVGAHGGPGELPAAVTVLSDEWQQPLARQNTRHLALLPAEELQTEQRQKIKDKAIN